jgi:hypothetical protein
MISHTDNSAGCPRPIPPFLAADPPPKPDPALEREVRALRDKVFETLLADDAWLVCREYWLTPDNIAWLREEAARCKT